MLEQFTCISFDKMDFLIPSNYIVAGFFKSDVKSSSNIIYNWETLPHLYLPEIIMQEFHCSTKGVSDVALIMRKQDFAKDVRVHISNHTKTAFPFTGNFALSFGTEIRSIQFDTSELRLFGKSLQQEMQNNGISGIRFCENRNQFLIAPDLLIRKFFAGALL